ncbi:response regulator [Paenibacillus pasadenensis]|uniref:response regulator n=1 Tax=Paenibacillus pasadenensis TaxID=217090 RepID=UPI00203B787F|nr:response regulator [Paenibacillus pasadenensis]MCM3745863.1 response regulator [Paenibacillus pasadenensis]
MIRVMLIDDEEDALDLLEILLGKMGNVQVVGRYMNPVQAIEALNHSPVDAVFLDNQMPGMKGTEAARKIRNMLPQLPIVFTTAYAEYAVEAFEIQSTDYLLKPFTIDRLHSAVTRIQQSLPAQSVIQPQAGQRTTIALTVQCMGGFLLALPGDTSRGLAWKTKKEKELCAFLIHHAGKTVSTAAILEAIWPGYDLNKAKTYLYTCLSYLRKSLAEHHIPIRITKADQGFGAELDGDIVDIIQFERLLNEPGSEEEMNEGSYNKMNRLYKGEYMEACDFGWAIAKQLEIKALYMRLLRNWYAFFQSQGKLTLAADSLQKVLLLSPDSENDGRELIKLHLNAGNRKEAYDVCLQLEQAVRMQLGTELEEETLRLIQHTKNKSERQTQ